MGPQRRKRAVRAMPPATTAKPAQSMTIEALELWVSGLTYTRDLLTTAFGFQPAGALAGGELSEAAASLVSGDVRVILRQGTSGASPISRHVARHGDTVADVALSCSDPGAVAARARSLGLAVSGAPGAAKIDLLGDGTVCHTVREARLFADQNPVPGSPLTPAVDHVAYCLPKGSADVAARLYEEVFGLQRSEADSFEAVGDEATGMRSIVLRSGPGFTVVLTEPVSLAGTGQIRKFLDAHAGPGVQHVALAYGDIFRAVEVLRSSGVEFLPIPSAYYEQARQQLLVPGDPIPWAALRRLGILVDSDEGGLLFQLFTRPLTRQGTFFVELIQRVGAVGFGANNVRALYEAVQATLTSDSGHPDPAVEM